MKVAALLFYTLWLIFVQSSEPDSHWTRNIQTIWRNAVL